MDTSEKCPEGERSESIQGPSGARSAEGDQDDPADCQGLRDPSGTGVGVEEAHVGGSDEGFRRQPREERGGRFRSRADEIALKDWATGGGGGLLTKKSKQLGL